MAMLTRGGAILGGLAVTFVGFVTVGVGLLGVVAGQLAYAVLILVGAGFVPLGWYGVVAGIEPSEADVVTTDPLDPNARGEPDDSG